MSLVSSPSLFFLENQCTIYLAYINGLRHTKLGCQ
uniref:Uncharacterized protein n=1 Tax=Arundo donax TaxID=35708 RepID=A0A0A9BF12_ARUDO